MQRVGDRPDRRLVEGAGVTGRKDDQAPRTTCDRYRDRRVARYCSIGKIEIVEMYRGESCWYCSARDDGLRSRTFRQHDGIARQNIGCDDMNRDFCIFQIAVGEILIDELAQRI